MVIINDYIMGMETMTVTDFKAHALRVFDKISKTGLPVIVTRHGKPIARILPYVHPDTRPQPGRLAHTVTFEKDLISPLGGEMWEAAR